MQPSRRVQVLPGYPFAELPHAKRRLLAQGVDVIDLGAGDTDIPPPAPVTAALAEALANPALSKYGFQQGLPAYREAIARFMERRFGVSVDPAGDLVPLIGSKEGLAHLPLAVLNPGDVAIVPEPGYQPYRGGTLLADAEPYLYPLRAAEDFLVHLDRVPADVLARTRLVFLNYPNNPTAAVAPRAYLEQVIAICRERGIVLAYDNAYCEVTFDGYRAPSILEIPGARDVAIEFFSLSKSYSMTGWRLGWAVGNRDLVGILTRVKTYIDTGPFLALQQAAVVALDTSEALTAPICAELAGRRDAMIGGLQAVGFPVTAPKAAMYLWVPMPDDVDDARFAEVALEEHGVIVLPGSALGPTAGTGYFRIALTVGPERLIEAAGRLGRALTQCREARVATTA